jgi:hypothetical protein
MTVGTSFYHVVVPVEKTNFIVNPSFEIGTAQWTGTANINTAGSVVFGSAAESQAFGAWSARVTGATGTFGITTTTTNRIEAGTSYTVSAYVRVTSDTGAGGSVLISPGQRVGVGSTWTRISVGTTAGGAGASWLIRIYHQGETTGTLWVDGVQREVGSITTYADGDQEGCQWLGLPHQSQSTRSGQSRAGGSVIPLSALGLRTETHVGVGMPPMVNVNLPRAILDGAEYQRTRADTREFVLTATLVGTTTPDLHRTRRRIIDALKIDRTFPPAPTRFIYTGAGEDVEIDAIYNGGLEITDMQVINDNVAARFVAFDPMWYSSLDEGTALGTTISIGSVQGILYRDSDGRWGTMGRSNTGTALNGGAVYVINTQYPGTVVVGGDFGTAGGTTSRGIAYYAGGSWGTFGGTVNGSVFALQWTPNLGTLIIGGAFSEIRGTTVVGGIGYYVRATGAFGTLGGTIRDGTAAGGAPGTIYALETGPSGQLLIGGAFSTVAGTLVRGIVQWTGNNSYGTLEGGTLGTVNITLGVSTAQFVCVNSIKTYSSDSMVLVGSWQDTNGTANRHGAIYNFTSKSWGTIPTPYIAAGTGVLGSVASELTKVTVNNQKRIFANGYGSVVLGISANNAFLQLQPERQVFQNLAADIRQNIISIRQDVITLSDNKVLSTGASGTIATVAGTTPSFYPWSNIFNNSPLLTYAVWNGYSVVPPDFSVPSESGLDTLVYAFGQDTLGTLYVGGTIRATSATSAAAAYAGIVNQGMADAYPVIYMRNVSTTDTRRVWSVVNNTTNDELYFNLLMFPQEEVTINTTPGRRSITSSQRGNMISSLLTGSNLATWRLIPGTNWVSSMAQSSILTNIYWRPRHWAIDGGAEPTI